MTGNREDAIARSTQYLDTGEFEAELARRVAIRTESRIADKGLNRCAVEPPATSVLFKYPTRNK